MPLPWGAWLLTYPGWEGKDRWDPEPLCGSEQLLPCRGASTDGVEKDEDQDEG